MDESGYVKFTGKAVSSMEDIRNLELSPLDKTMARQAASHVVEDDLTIHEAYHLATALCWRAEAFVTRDLEEKSLSISGS